MSEKLQIKRLGPIDELEIAPRPFTVILGEQASGKSLIAQLFYFFRTLKSELARSFSPERGKKKGWQDRAVKQILDSLRGVPFLPYANGTASLRYTADSDDIEWGIDLYSVKGSIRVLKSLADDMDAWEAAWTENNEILGKDRSSSHIFIPTERSYFTRISESEKSILFADYQPLPFRRFADWLERAKTIIRTKNFEGHSDIFDYVTGCQRRALKGEPRVSDKTDQWEFEITGDSKRLTMSALSSGQMEAWPFFIVASVFGSGQEGRPSQFYFEEPETHLHPTAQIEVMKAIAGLVNVGNKFMVTTHSVFPLYCINNMLQAYHAFGRGPREDTVGLLPEYVAAYRLVNGSAVSIMDRTDTGLIDIEELERVADKLNLEFERYLAHEMEKS